MTAREAAEALTIDEFATLMALPERARQRIVKLVEQEKREALAAKDAEIAGLKEAARQPVFNAATILAQLSRQQSLDDRDRESCATIRKKLEDLEKLLWPPEHSA